MKPGATVWLTGLPASGKSTLATLVQEKLEALATPSVILDGDDVRDALFPSVRYTPGDRDMFYATLGRLAGLLARQGLIVLVPATANLRRYRDEARAFSPRFIEVHVAVDAHACARRDPKGLYARAASDPSNTLPGVGAPYEPPLHPDVIAEGGADQAAANHIAHLATTPH